MKKDGEHIKTLSAVSLSGVQPRLPFPGSRKCDLAHILTRPITRRNPRDSTGNGLSTGMGEGFL